MLRFDEFRLDLDARQLTRRARAVHLSPKALLVTCHARAAASSTKTMALAAG